ncbi:prepilin-type N-terminal cleavage/methylation domain-containing protein [Candidatus Dependentiae bacterium]|nr:prepilin-type N-terminal cleavage/methylation domain-containing protein [Candidatus Dependentiae bacterium]
MKKGFSLAELMVAILLASLISLSLFQLLNQTRKVVRRIVNVIEVDEPYVAFYTHIEKDVIGMFSPYSSIQAYAEKDKKEEQLKKAATGKTADQKPPENSPEKGSETIAIEPVMVFDAQKENVYWSFITTGGLHMLDAKGARVPSPFVRRVAYLLERDPQRPSLYRLMYRFSTEKLQGQELQGASFTPSYELLSGIKQVQYEFTLIEIVEKKAGPAGATQQALPVADKHPVTTAVLKEWKESDIWKKYKALIPAYVKISGVVTDATGSDHDFEFLIKVPAYAPYKPREESLSQRIERIASDIFGKNGKKS